MALTRKELTNKKANNRQVNRKGTNCNETAERIAGEKAIEEKKQNYEKYVKEMTPTHNLFSQMAKAFLVGGIICVIGQGITNFAIEYLHADKVTAAGICSICLILLSVILTGLNLYSRIVKWGGAGALVPITGFANSVAAPAIEFQKEGWVFGVGCKIFTIAGPVILYGIFTSWLLGLGYWICTTWGFFGM